MKAQRKILLVAFVFILLCWLGFKLYKPKYYIDDKSDRWITLSEDNTIKDRIVSYVDSVNKRSGKFTVPSKWLHLMPEVDSSGSTFDHLVIYFSEVPEEMYFVEFTPMPQVRAVFNPAKNSRFWIWGSKEFSSVDKKRIITRFDNEVLLNVK